MRQKKNPANWIRFYTYMYFPRTFWPRGKMDLFSKSESLCIFGRQMFLFLGHVNVRFDNVWDFMPRPLFFAPLEVHFRVEVYFRAGGTDGKLNPMTLPIVEAIGGKPFLLIRGMVVQCCYRWFGCETIHPTQKFTSMNLLQMPCVITYLGMIIFDLQGYGGC